jgi:hypothetical protein
MASLKRKVHEVQAATHVAGLKTMRAAVELHEELNVAMGQRVRRRKNAASPCQKRSLTRYQQGLHVTFWACSMNVSPSRAR